MRLGGTCSFLFFGLFGILALATKPNDGLSFDGYMCHLACPGKWTCQELGEWHFLNILGLMWLTSVDWKTCACDDKCMPLMGDRGEGRKEMRDCVSMCLFGEPYKEPCEGQYLSWIYEAEPTRSLTLLQLGRTPRTGVSVPHHLNQLLFAQGSLLRRAPQTHIVLCALTRK